MKDMVAIILAAGEGTRMKSGLPKVLHQVCGKPMIEYVIDRLEELNIDKKIVIIGYKGNLVKETLGKKVDYIWQKEQLGTGHALAQCREILAKFKGDLLVLSGDTPLLTTQTLKRLIEVQREKNALATILTAILKPPTGYGRVVRHGDGTIRKIVEEEDATIIELANEEVNAGTYCFKKEAIFQALEKIRPENVQEEYYLTDAIEVLTRKGHRVEACTTDEADEIIGINSRKDLSLATKIMREHILDRLMLNGVTIIDPLTTTIDREVEIGRDTIIYPFTIVEGKTKIGQDCIIGPAVQIKDSKIAHKVEIKNSSVQNSIIESEARIGPYAHLRPESRIGKKAKIGNFVEIKKSTIGKESKVSHMSYIGDATLGENINIGAGTITCNYDGFKKYPTYIEDKVFVGSNTNFIAPVKIGKGAVIGAGSTITEDVPPYALAIARGRQRNIKGWAKKKTQRK
ncbi:bifunctional UDP-N-acetylglucosamine diphosphorylase/glucosamine-1-phosphate N-acetyltransferase GlmU [bacterium]|nr:bifunctional UDP-N-acetylglucosamine diphosphorylase/glucosamine-1-phosphate N-acetyltransferase GlmU [bacterium]MCG2678008.1 bifunctional UDP-N-acetylglucosamine diphosphorylase/glucosamine-1-phosphate N-acetyltransferase GlmU [bacterium]